jgi:hypothetical protein
MARAADPAAVLAPYVNDDTFLAAYVDLATLPKDGVRQYLRVVRLLPYMSDDGSDWTAALDGFGKIVEALPTGRVDAVYIVAALSDINAHGGPLIVFHLGAGGEANDFARTLAALIPKDMEVRPHGQDAVIGGTPAALDRYSNLVGSERADLLGPLQKLSEEGAVVAAVFSPGPDFRRVVRELWPKLPGPLAPLKGELADRWLRLELATNLPPDAKPRLTLQTSDADAAQTFVTVLNALPDACEAFTELDERRLELKRYLQTILGAVTPRVDGTRVTIGFPTQEAEITALQNLVARASDAAMESSRRNQRFNRFKQLAIAMHNYHDVNKHFPPASICDEDGRPLLSWRVAILPYIDQSELYKQFRLDEPWDSPHNRALIERMPAEYADPDPKFAPLAREGKTTFQVPVSPETVFHDNDGTTIREIIDGTSKTVLVVEVEPLRAAVWTKPEDWEVDLRYPRRGVERTDRTNFAAAFADGHVQTIALDKIDDATLRAILTRSGREVIPQP